ncbi:L domain-like protein [Ascobolus immersus RN42]|uniref:L domain-like protein n=1 Tax=Ascobolus immersus RN42 TaxID=1160509 RepID=A0A3N4IG24_ASCIM|nr:L domain-like protein [Ascobolus immersus RN42]
MSDQTKSQAESKVDQKPNGIHQDGKVDFEAKAKPETSAPETTQNESSEGTEELRSATTERRAVLQHTLSEHEHSDDEEDPVPQEPIDADEDLLDDCDPDCDEIDLIKLRISSIPALNLSRFPNLRRLCLRENLITSLPGLPTSLTELDLYDNRLPTHALTASESTLHLLKDLETLDLSYNKIRAIPESLASDHPELRNLYFVQNKISKIQGVSGLQHLHYLELGANRIRVIENLENLPSLQLLWLGKNKITSIGSGLSTLTNLRTLAIQSNRITSLEGLEALTALEELYVSHNGITSLTTEATEDKPAESYLKHNTNLRVIDISNNRIEHLTGLSHLRKLEELWASNNQIASFDEIERELGGRKEEDGETIVKTVYFEGNPVQRNNEVLYRGKVRMALPEIEQIDATYVRVA